MNVVSNTSPLITLAKADFLDLLPQLFQWIRIPKAVCDEIQIGPNTDPMKVVLQKSPSWIQWIEIQPPMSPLASWQLGPGESEVIEWARLHTGSLALLDDALARKIAKHFNIPICGTIGVIALAKQKNLISSFLDSAKKLQDVGLYLNQRLIKKVAKNLGEI